MRKKFIYSILTISITGLLSGCGGGGGGSSASFAELGKGYYIDSPVAGVEYKCGNTTGITGKDGNFTFEKGKDCNFELAGVPLRTIKADELKDGIKIVEDNLTVARFLQSLDIDGNPDNGIQIKDEVLEALKEAVKTLEHKDDALDKDLDEVVTHVRQKVPDFDGDIKDKDEAFEHLSKTLTPEMKELLAGKTFYAVKEKENEGTDEELKAEYQVTFSKDLSNIDVKVIASTDPDVKDESSSFELKGNKLIWDDGSYSLVYQKGEKLLVINYDTEGKKEGKIWLFKTKAEADKMYQKESKEKEGDKDKDKDKKNKDDKDKKDKHDSDENDD
jgi:hypothetical protein